MKPTTALPGEIDAEPRPLPTEDELPYSDGEPMDSDRHRQQMCLLIDTLTRHWESRDDVFVGGNMFVHHQRVPPGGRYFKGPDVFVVQGVPRRERKSWVVWHEGKGPDVVVELLSRRTRHVDQGERLRAYRDDLRVPEYFWFDPFRPDFAGFHLVAGQYEPVGPDSLGRLHSAQLDLDLVPWRGVHQRKEATWLRWALTDGTLLPTPTEAEERAQARADQAEQRADDAEEQAAVERRKLERLEARLRAAGIDPDAAG